MKIINSTLNSLTNREIENFKSLNSPYIVKYYEHFIDSTNFYFIMEYCQVITFNI